VTQVKDAHPVLNKPEKLPEMLKPGTFISCEELLGVAKAAYKAKTGQWNMPYDGPEGPGELKGVLLTEDDDLKKKYPRIWKKYYDKF
jgi:hypothetical protein